MRILIALPIAHPRFHSIDSIVDGTAPCSGTTGAIIRLAAMLSDAGVDVCLSAASSSHSTKFPCIKHELIEAAQFDCLVVHQTHWNGAALTFGNQYLAKTFLWLHNQTSWALVHTFLQAGGNRVICPSIYHANIYRAIPQWRQKVKVVYNSYCPAFTPTQEQPQKRLLFIGAITPNKGFVELMQIWSYLAHKQVDLQLAIAGDISIHKGSSVQVGSLGVAEADLETNQIQPWLKTLPNRYQPHFLGALSPVQLCTAIAQCWAVIVNPSWVQAETFCISAVDAQACDRTVFSVADGGLKETVYQGNFHSLAQDRSPKAVGERIIDGLSNMEAIEQNGRLAGEFVRSKFSHHAIHDAWMRVLSGQDTEAVLPRNWGSPRELICDLMRLSGTGMLVNQFLLKRYV